MNRYIFYEESWFAVSCNNNFLIRIHLASLDGALNNDVIFSRMVLLYIACFKTHFKEGSVSQSIPIGHFNFSHCLTDVTWLPSVFASNTFREKCSDALFSLYYANSINLSVLFDW